MVNIFFTNNNLLKFSGQIQQLKKSVNKDKKRKKEIAKEISDLEENLKKRHEEELKKLHGSTQVDSGSKV